MIFEQIFNKKIKNPGCVISSLSSEPLIIVTDQVGYLKIFNNSTGDLINEIQVECQTEIWALISAQIDEYNYFIITGSAAGILYAFNIRKSHETKTNEIDIKLLWKQKTDDLITKIEYFDINNSGFPEIIASSLDKTIRVLNPNNGEFIWGQLFQHGVTTFKIGDTNDNGAFEAIIGTGDGVLSILDGKTGEFIHKLPLSNNIRTIQIIKHPNRIICGCDDAKIYIIDGKDGLVLKTLDQDNYVWYSKYFDDIDNLLISTYSFKFMEKLMENDQDDEIDEIDESSVTLYNPVDFTKIWEHKGINIQCMTGSISYKEKEIIGFGTTEKTIIILDVKSGEILFREKTGDIVNSVYLFKVNDYLLFYFCDDENMFQCIKISET